MRHTVYFSGKRDPDIIALYREVGLEDFKKIMRDALCSTVRIGYIPKYTSLDKLCLQVTDEDISINLKIKLCMTSQKESDITDLLLQVKPRQLSNFIKTAMKFYIGRAICLRALLDTNSEVLKQIEPIQVFNIGTTAFNQQSTVKEKVRAKRKPTQKKVSEIKTEYKKPVNEILKRESIQDKEEKTVQTNALEVKKNANTQISDNCKMSEYDQMNDLNDTDDMDDMLDLLDGLMG